MGLIRIILWDLYYKNYTMRHTIHIYYETYTTYIYIYTMRLILWDVLYIYYKNYTTCIRCILYIYCKTYTIYTIRQTIRLNMLHIYYETYTIRLWDLYSILAIRSTYTIRFIP